MTRHCFNCGWEWKLAHMPGRRDTCDECNTDLRCCRNCVHYDMIVAHQCRERRAEPVDEKDRNNYCEYFDFAGATSRNRASRRRSNPRDEAKETLRKLLGD